MYGLGHGHVFNKCCLFNWSICNCGICNYDIQHTVHVMDLVHVLFKCHIFMNYQRYTYTNCQVPLQWNTMHKLTVAPILSYTIVCFCGHVMVSKWCFNSTSVKFLATALGSQEEMNIMCKCNTIHSCWLWYFVLIRLEQTRTRILAWGESFMSSKG